MTDWKTRNDLYVKCEAVAHKLGVSIEYFEGKPWKHTDHVDVDVYTLRSDTIQFQHHQYVCSRMRDLRQMYRTLIHIQTLQPMIASFERIQMSRGFAKTVSIKIRNSLHGQYYLEETLVYKENTEPDSVSEVTARHFDLCDLIVDFRQQIQILKQVVKEGN